MSKAYLKRIMAMDADELELFVDSWMSRKRRTYHETEVWAGSGDKGRDVACYITSRKLEGPWHLFQCKQLKGTLSLPNAMRELGKMFHHAAAGAYALPERYVFVAPQNVSRPLKELVASPSRFRQALLDGWDHHCADRVVENARVPLSPGIRTLVQDYDFGQVFVQDALRILNDPDAMATLVSTFGHDPGDYPLQDVPMDEQPEEAVYLRQLVDAYGERSGAGFSGVADVVSHGEHRDHLTDQRERFFHASSFKRHYRDNTPEEMLVAFEEEIYHGVVDAYREDAADALARVDKVMRQANAVHPCGVLGRHGRVQVRQGVCHHFANENRFAWKHGRR